MNRPAGNGNTCMSNVVMQACLSLTASSPIPPATSALSSTGTATATSSSPAGIRGRSSTWPGRRLVPARRLGRHQAPGDRPPSVRPDERLGRETPAAEAEFVYQRSPGRIGTIRGAFAFRTDGRTARRNRRRRSPGQGRLRQPGNIGPIHGPFTATGSPTCTTACATTNAQPLGADDRPVLRRRKTMRHSAEDTRCPVCLHGWHDARRRWPGIPKRPSHSLEGGLKP